MTAFDHNILIIWYCDGPGKSFAMMLIFSIHSYHCTYDNKQPITISHGWKIKIACGLGWNIYNKEKYFVDMQCLCNTTDPARDAAATIWLGKTLSATKWVKVRWCLDFTQIHFSATVTQQGEAAKPNISPLIWTRDAIGDPLLYCSIFLILCDYHGSGTRTMGALAQLNATCCLINTHSSSIMTGPYRLQHDSFHTARYP